MSSSLPSFSKLRFIIVNSFTIASLAVGLLSLSFTMTGMLEAAAICLLCSVLLDGCDGNLARKWKVTSPFGAQLDSLADMSSFGVATAVLAYYWLMEKEPSWTVLVMSVSGLVALMSAIRLARFNVTPKNDSFFQGIPTTGASCIIAITYLTSPQLGAIWAVILVGAIALLMVSVFPYIKIDQLMRLPKWLYALMLVGLALGAWLSLSTTVLLAAAVYICSGPLLWLVQRLTK